MKCIDLANAIDDKFPRWPEWVSISDDYDYIINETPSSHWRTKHNWQIKNDTEDEIINYYNTSRSKAIDKRSKIKFR